MESYGQRTFFSSVLSVTGHFIKWYCPLRAHHGTERYHEFCKPSRQYHDWRIGTEQMSGAAIATVISRYVEMIIVAGWTHRHADKNPFVEGLYRTMKVPLRLVKKFFLTGVPLLINETLWGAEMAMLTQCYSVRGSNVVAAVPDALQYQRAGKRTGKALYHRDGSMPQNAFLNAAYFTLRSGGKTVVTFLFDCGFVWCVSVPNAYILSRFTGLQCSKIKNCR